MSTDAVRLPDAARVGDATLRVPAALGERSGVGDLPNDHLRTIIDSIPTMVWSARPDGSTEFLNRRCLEYAGLPADAVHSWDWMALVHPDERERTIEYWRGILNAGASGETEVRMRGVNGAYRWFLVRISPAYDASGRVTRWYGTNTDIEERRSAEDALRASEHHLRSILDTLPGLAVVSDATVQVEMVNQRVLDYFGKSFEELLAGPPGDGIHPDDLVAQVARSQRGFETGVAVDGQLRLRRADGTYRWFQSQSVPLRDASGRVVRWATLLTDIEEMQRVAEALQASEQRLREVIDGIPTFIYTMAPTGEPEFINRPYLEYLGKTAEEMMDWAHNGVIHEDDLASSMAIWARGVETGRDYSLELRLRRADGVFRWFELRSRTVRDAGGRIVRSYGVVADIHDRKRAERRLRRAMGARQDALRASARGLREIVDRVPGLVYTMTPEGQVEHVNQRILDYFGRTGDALKSWAMTDVVHPADLPRVVAAWRRAVDTGMEYQIEQRLRRADGAYRWFRGRSLAVRNSEGHIVQWYGLLTDIDDEKRAQRRLRRAMRARYEAVLAERTRIARDMHDGLLQDLSGLTLQLGAALPHVRSEPDAAANQLGRVLDEAQRVNRVARDAVLGMRVQAGAADLVSAVHDEAQRLTATGGLALSVRVSGRPRLVPAAMRDAAVSIVHEALTNVLKHASARTVRMSLAFRHTELRLTVRDDGRGMGTERDADDSTARFGLLGMRECAASIGAELSLASVPGRGTSVRLHLPLLGESPTGDGRARLRP